MLRIQIGHLGVGSTMKFASLKLPHSPLGIVCQDHCFQIPSGDPWPSDIVALIENFEQLREPLLELTRSETPIPLAATKLAAPISNCEKIICIGKNYAQHAIEMGSEPPTLPVVFSKFASAINHPDAPIVRPVLSEQLDYEAELVVVIGKPGKNIPRQQAFEHVFGYCCGNDITARDWQKGKPGGQWLLGKTCDTFAPLGPYLVTADEVLDPHDLSIQLRVNGELRQDSNTSQLIFPIDVLIAHVSQFFTLRPGDLIFTGTPPGVGAGRSPQLFLKSGDEIEVRIDGLGVLKNHVVDEDY